MKEAGNRQQRFISKSGVTYFSKQTERRVLFVLTLGMLAWGIVEYLNSFF